MQPCPGKGPGGVYFLGGANFKFWGPENFSTAWGSPTPGGQTGLPMGSWIWICALRRAWPLSMDGAKRPIDTPPNANNYPASGITPPLD